MADEEASGSELPAVRRDRIVGYVDSMRQASIHEIADHVDVSLDTVRRDLAALHRAGMLTRTRGGAVANSVLNGRDRELRVRRELQEQEKARIAECAVGYIDDNSSLGLNGGTTTLAVARALSTRRNLIVATNSLSIPFEVSEQAVKHLYIIGGDVRFSSQVTLGHSTFADEVVPGIANFDTVVIGVGGLTPEGASVSNLGEAAVTRQMVRRALRVVVVADSTKFNRRQFAMAATLDEIDYLVTDAAPPAQIREPIEAAGGTVVVAEG